jgi:hypothetical protein
VPMALLAACREIAWDNPGPHHPPATQNPV